MMGRLNIILLKILIDGQKDNILISSIGFNIISFEFLIDNFIKIFRNHFDNKRIIILDCNLNDDDDVKNIEQYFSI